MKIPHNYFLVKPKLMVCFQTSKLEVLGVQLRGLRVFNLCLVESNLVCFENDLVLQYRRNDTNLS